MLPLAPDELLSTTRSVRKRLDLDRPVEREVLEQCLALAQQAPTATNLENWHFVVVTSADKRAALGEVYRRGAEVVIANFPPEIQAQLHPADPHRQAQMDRVWSSSAYLVEHLHEVPVLVVPCIAGRVEGQSSLMQSALWGSIAPAAWSFMLAARARGLGTCWTCFHLAFEREAAEILGIPYEAMTQVALIPVAYTKGTDFRPAARAPLKTCVHWEGW